MAKAEIWAGSILTIFAVYFTYESLQLPFWTEFGPGAGTLPVLSGICFGALSIGLMVRNLPKQSARTEEAESLNWRSPATIALAMFLAILLAETTGMLLSVFLYLCVHTVLVARANWKPALLLSLLSTIGFYLVFKVLLGVPLSVGVLGV